MKKDLNPCCESDPSEAFVKESSAWQNMFSNNDWITF